MRDDKDEPFRGKFFQEREDGFRVLFVEGARRLVGKDEIGLFDEHAGDGDALLLPARERARAAGGVFPHPDGA